MRMSLSAEGAACALTRQNAGRALKIPAAPAIRGGSSTGNLKAPAGTTSALRIFVCGRESFARDSQEDWACAAEANAERRNSAKSDFFMVIPRRSGKNITQRTQSLEKRRTQ